MKRAPFQYGVTEEGGAKYFRSIDEYLGTPEFQKALEEEFPQGASELDPDDREGGFTRRSFMKVMGASVALAGATGCRRPEEKILPYAHAPESVIPGKPQFYATAVPWNGTTVGLVIESHGGRPTKIEGNPQHSESGGGTNAFLQAMVLGLYDPERSQSPSMKGAPKSWDDAIGALTDRTDKLKAQGGKGLAILAEPTRSPTRARLFGELKAAFPQARIVEWEPYFDDGSYEGTKLLTGAPADVVYDLDQAGAILSLDSDFLQTEPGAIRNSLAFVAKRRLQTGADKIQNRLYAVESQFSITGSNADHRIRLLSRDIPGFLGLVATALVQKGVQLDGALVQALAARKVTTAAKLDKLVPALAKDLVENKGVILVGRAQPAAIHAAVHAINAALKAPVALKKAPASNAEQGTAALAQLVAAMKGGEVDTLLILDGNPVFTTPADLGFVEALGKVAASFHLADSVDETSAKTTWHLNRAHFLESWGDALSAAGQLSIIQPLIAPLYHGRSDLEVVARLLQPMVKGLDLVKATHSTITGKDWRKLVHDGVRPMAGEAAALDPSKVAAAVGQLPTAAAGLEVRFVPCAHTWDGRFANSGWMQEMPDPMTKITWDNAALVSPAHAKKAGWKDGDLIQITVDGKSAKLPVFQVPGTADDVIVVQLGQGRKNVGKVGKDVGFDAFPLRSTKGLYFATATVAATGAKHTLAQTQEHFAMEGRAIVREANLTKFAKDPAFAKKMVKFPPLLSLFPDYKYDGHKWGMAIDLNSCIGCNACMVACQAENNIPVVGKEGVLRTREMHWIRVDRYFVVEGMESEDEMLHHPEKMGEARAVMLPLGCQQCENAPCEQVCPVGATTHSPEGLNDMAYNRCIGTRYCINNCPFKVRRFNFFNYNKDIPASRQLQYNPDVTIRFRGVVEKCTYCVQRIQNAKIEVHRDGKDRVPDGTIQTACQQGCPTKAITFGDLNDKNSAVSKAAANPRNYLLLEELNIRPRTSYLAKITNPNPELEGA